MALPYEFGWSDPREGAESFDSAIHGADRGPVDRWAERVDSVEAMLVDDGVAPDKARRMARRIVEADVSIH